MVESIPFYLKLSGAALLVNVIKPLKQVNLILSNTVFIFSNKCIQHIHVQNYLGTSNSILYNVLKAFYKCMTSFNDQNELFIRGSGGGGGGSPAEVCFVP